MRRLLRSIARGEEIVQDMSTLENPAILEQLRGGAAPAPLSAKRGKSSGTEQEDGACRDDEARQHGEANQGGGALPRRGGAPTR